MKMTPGNYEWLKAHVLPLHSLAVMKWYRDAGFSPKRYRWDLIYAVPSAPRHLLFAVFYKYLDDSHIDTALRRITGLGDTWPDTFPDETEE